MSYEDTSIIVTALDPRIGKARELLERRNRKIISEVVLAGLAS